MPPRRSYSHKTTHPYQPPTAAPPRSISPLQDDELATLTKAIGASFGWPDNVFLRPFQLAGIRAQLEGTDAIIQAPTGSGKTVIAAGAHCSSRAKGMITLLTVPLIQLAEEMVITFRDEYHMSAIAIHSANGALSPLIVKDVLANKYQIIIVSPEMIQSRSFIKQLLCKPSFARRILSLIVDEAHCISLWGASFRKKYGTLGIIRTFLPRHTPVIAMTATLTGRVRRDIHSKLHFPRHGSLFHNEGNDRPNVSLVVRACQYPLNSFADLDFVLPQTIRHAADIPKTYIYVDNINVGGEIVDYLATLLEARLQQHHRTSDCRPSHLPVERGVIRPFNATLSQDYRNAAMQQFRLGEIRILVCTDAAGMGINVSNVDVVVQWKTPTTLSHFVQRAGRAARGHGQIGLAVLLVEPTAFHIDLTTTALNLPAKQSRQQRDKRDTTAGSPPTARKTRAAAAASKAYAIAHGLRRGGTPATNDGPPTGTQPAFDPEADDEGMLLFIQSTICRRQVWLSVFENNCEKPAARPNGVSCCDICDSRLFDRVRAIGVPAKEKGPPNKGVAPKKGVLDEAVQRKLNAWRRMVFNRDHALSMLSASAILDDGLVQDLARYEALDEQAMTSLLEGRWIWARVYGEELIAYLGTLLRPFVAAPKKPRIRRAAAIARHPAASYRDARDASNGRQWKVILQDLPAGAVVPPMVTGFAHHKFVTENMCLVLREPRDMSKMTQSFP
ncbi:P-loop containing nucleoside triphosphate hydrolase protein [Trametopsis cervina]|nr:P-loop containing nucleoside triphosphate hydrolase protein [Trametopsis cervina]